MELESTVRLVFDTAGMDKVQSAATKTREEIEKANRAAGRSGGMPSGGGGPGGPPPLPANWLARQGRTPPPLPQNVGSIPVRIVNTTPIPVRIVGAGMPGPTPSRQPGGGGGLPMFGLAATAAASSAFFFRAAALANPAAMERFQDALDDATATVGHRLVPYLNEFTRIIRQTTDWYTRQPKAVQEGIGLGITAGTVGLIGLTVATFVRQLWGTVSAARAFFGGGMTPGRGGGRGGMVVAGGGGGRTRGRGGRGGGIIGGGTGLIAGALIAEEAMAGIEAAQEEPTPEDRRGKLQRFTDRSMASTSWTARQAQSVYRWFREDVMGRQPRRPQGAPTGTGPGPGERYVGPSGRELHPAIMGGGGYGAAARPAAYQDVLSSVLAIRQQIASAAGNDPMKQTAENTKRSADALEKMAGTGAAGGGNFHEGMVGLSQQIIDDMMRGNPAAGATPRGGR